MGQNFGFVRMARPFTARPATCSEDPAHTPTHPEWQAPVELCRMAGGPTRLTVLRTLQEYDAWLKRI